MKKTLLLAVTATALSAGGYRIPENSLDSVALSAAYAANAHGAAAAYYNPAAMVFEDGGQKAEAALTYIGLTKVHFDGAAPQAGSGIVLYDGCISEAETFFVPTLHYVSAYADDWRFGLSFVTPAGLSKRWTEQPGRGYALEVTLQTVELNPSIAYRISPELAVGGGVRLLYATGIVESGAIGSRKMDGEGFAFGYNLALTYLPVPQASLAVTYRSNADLQIDGNAKLYFPDNDYFAGPKLYDGGGSVTLPVPAVLQVAGAYTFNETGPNPTTVEVMYERDYWSAFKDLDFDYDQDIGPLLTPSFDDPIPKNWRDTTVYRFGITQKLEAFTLMAGLALDETPVPEKSLNFELPDSDAIVYSAGMRFRLNEAWEFGGAVLYDSKKDRTVRGDQNDNGIDGTFSNSSALLVTLGTEYRF